LIIAEKPSVGEDLARVLPGPFKKRAGTGEKRSRALEGPDHIISWAIGHLVSLANPEEYDEKFKKWRMADLPIVPTKFKLEVRDERLVHRGGLVVENWSFVYPIHFYDVTT